MRELENIRNFLTSSALTLVIDLFFTLVFLAVMLFYSVALTAIVALSIPFYVAISAGLTPAFQFSERKGSRSVIWCSNE